MSGDPFRRAASGAPLRIRAAAYNAFLDAAADLRGHNSDISRAPSASAGDQRTVVLVRNDAETNVPRFGVLGVDGPLIGPEENDDEFSARVALRGAIPAIADHFGRFAITLEPIPAGNHL